MKIGSYSNQIGWENCTQLGSMRVQSWQNPNGTFTAHAVDSLFFLEAKATGRYRGTAINKAVQAVKHLIDEDQSFKKKSKKPKKLEPKTIIRRANK